MEAFSAPRFEPTFWAKLPYIFVNYWYLEAPLKIVTFWAKLLAAIEHFLSLSLMIKTFFRPWKNERRKGFVVYAIGISATLKFFIILFDLAVLALFLALGGLVFLFWILLPPLSVILILVPVRFFKT